MTLSHLAVWLQDHHWQRDMRAGFPSRGALPRHQLLSGPQHLHLLHLGLRSIRFSAPCYIPVARTGVVEPFYRPVEHGGSDRGFDMWRWRALQPRKDQRGIKVL